MNSKLFKEQMMRIHDDGIYGIVIESALAGFELMQKDAVKESDNEVDRNLMEAILSFESKMTA